MSCGGGWAARTSVKVPQVYTVYVRARKNKIWREKKLHQVHIIDDGKKLYLVNYPLKLIFPYTKVQSG